MSQVLLLALDAIRLILFDISEEDLPAIMNQRTNHMAPLFELVNEPETPHNIRTRVSEYICNLIRLEQCTDPSYLKAMVAYFKESPECQKFLSTHVEHPLSDLREDQTDELYRCLSQLVDSPE